MNRAAPLAQVKDDVVRPWIACRVKAPAARLAAMSPNGQTRERREVSTWSDLLLHIRL